MATTFLIGNGFDLNLGMKTKYSDFYDVYIKKPSYNENIKKFKQLLSDDKPNGYTTWGDFEIQMGKSAKLFDSEEDFVECVRDFRIHLTEYLENEEKLFNERLLKSTDLNEELRYSLFHFQEDLVDKYSRVISTIINKDMETRFITFNYTNPLEKILACLKFGKTDEYFYYTAPIHIHDILERGIVVGVDNVLQIDTGNKYKISNSSEMAFVKTLFNNQVNDNIVSESEISIITSDIICVFGLSLGDSDLIWRNALKNWLLSNDKHHLVYYIYDENKYDRRIRDLIIEKENYQKHLLLKRMFGEESYDRVFEQVHIPIMSRAFCFKEKIDSENKRIMDVADKNKKRIDDIKKELATV